MNNWQTILEFNKILAQFPIYTEKYQYHIQSGSQPITISGSTSGLRGPIQFFKIADDGIDLNSGRGFTIIEIMEMKDELETFLKQGYTAPKLEQITAYDEMLTQLNKDLRKFENNYLLHCTSKPTGISVHHKPGSVVEFKIKGGKLVVIYKAEATDEEIKVMTAEIMSCLEGDVNVL